MSVCRHVWARSDKPDYDVCSHCLTFHSRAAAPPETIYTADYWSHERGHSTLTEQVFNCDSHAENGKSKNQFILDLIDVEDRSAALEIGCAPGALLTRLHTEARFLFVHGIDPVMEPSIQHTVEVHRGFFPERTSELTAGRISLIVACDVFEHSHEPEAFLAECARLLKKGGQLILMLPLVGPDMPERMFLAEEHVYLHNEENLALMMEDAGLSCYTSISWTAGHDVMCARRVA